MRSPARVMVEGMRLKKLLPAASLPILALLVVTGCAQEDTPSESPATSEGTGDTAVNDQVDSALLTDRGWEDASTEAIIDELDRVTLADRDAELIASVRVDELVLASDDEEIALPIPDEQFYFAFAPYVNQNHDCFYHSLTTCVGELQNEQIEVLITDEAGEVLVDETVTTFDNGFYAVWLPRDITGQITINHGEQTVTAPISTDAEAPTCVTTLQLA